MPRPLADIDADIQAILAQIQQEIGAKSVQDAVAAIHSQGEQKALDAAAAICDDIAKAQDEYDAMDAAGATQDELKAKAGEVWSTVEDMHLQQGIADAHADAEAKAKAASAQHQHNIDQLRNKLAELLREKERAELNIEAGGVDGEPDERPGAGGRPPRLFKATGVTRQELAGVLATLRARLARLAG